MPGLKLCWMIEWPDGHHAGPYHVSSLGEMLADGELDGNEMVRHIHTQQTASLLQTLQQGLLAGELHLGEGTLTAALCGMMRGQTDEALTVTKIPAAPAASVPTATPVPQVEPAPSPQPVASIPATEPEQPKPAPAAAIKSAHPKQAVRVALPAQHRAPPPTLPAVNADALTVAKRILVTLVGGAKVAQSLEQQLAKVPAALKKNDAALATAREEVAKAHTAQDAQTKLAQQATAEAAQKLQVLQAESAKLRSELETAQTTHATVLATAREELATACAAQESQAKLAQQAAADAAQKMQVVQAEAAKLRGELETLQKTHAAGVTWRGTMAPGQ
ncbi:MAG: hypothetical protein NTY53_16450 [Kiritimatiellaeota bacterium]|nr:hypothetical protein [Kiritimatiellota bacterium]